MLTFDTSNGECLVFVYREGLFSAIGHDLKIRVSRWHVSVDVDRRSLTGQFDVASLKVVSAIREGTETPGLSPGDLQEIEAKLRRDVLEVEAYPVASLIATFQPMADSLVRIHGSLALHGRQREIRAEVRKKGRGQETELQLDQRDFGIRPYAAFLGALRVKPKVTIRLTLWTDVEEQTNSGANKHSYNTRA